MNNYVKHPTVQVGDILRCTKEVLSGIGTTVHQRNDEEEVTQENLDYFQQMLGVEFEQTGRTVERVRADSQDDDFNDPFKSGM